MILHLDMDAFFASVEQMDNPDLAGKPVIIGGGNRGVVATASYEARVYGIHSAMPAAMARKLCPDGIFLRGNYHRYRELSDKIINSLRDFSPIIQQASIDEAYLALPENEEPEKLAQTIKKTVAEASGGLTCSVGLAPVKFLAKIASDMNKPDGVFIIRPGEVENFLLPLCIEKLPGVGGAMAKSLHAFGIGTVEQLRGLSRPFLEKRYGKFGLLLYDRARGIDPRPVRENQPAKSEGRERTFQENIRDRSELEIHLRSLVEKVSLSLRKEGAAGRTVTLKIKFADFHQLTRARTLPFRTNAPEAIFQAASELLATLPLPQPARLLGVCVSGFEARPEQLPLPGLPEKCVSGGINFSRPD